MKQSTYIAYICPNCGVVLTYQVDIVALTNGVETKCGCGGSELEITYNRTTKKIQISVPCIGCASSHLFHISAENFFNSEILLLPCSISGFDICFIGDKPAISKEIKRCVREIEEILRQQAEEYDEDLEEDGEYFDDEHEECDCGECHHHHHDNTPLPYYDVIAMSGVLRIIKEMMEEENVLCSCGEDASNIELTLNYDSIKLTCKSCGKNVLIPAKTDGDIMNIAQTAQIYLK